MCSSLYFLPFTPTAENEQPSASYSTVKTKEQETAFQLKELELKGGKEHFQDKERELHKEIEVARIEKESQENARMADQEKQKLKQRQIEIVELGVEDAQVSATH